MNIFDIIECESDDSEALLNTRRCTRKSQSQPFDDEGQGLPAVLTDMSVIDVDPIQTLLDSATIEESSHITVFR
jgi:hypothetical protein